MKLWIAALLILLGVEAGEPVWVGATDTTMETARTSGEPPPPLRLQQNPRILSREEVEKALEPHLPSIMGCYQEHTAKLKNKTGVMQLELLIRPEGKVDNLWVRARGVRGPGLRDCVRELARTWTFPKKDGFTNAVVRFYFPKSSGQDEGPVDDCWSSNGCLAQMRRPSTWPC